MTQVLQHLIAQEAAAVSRLASPRTNETLASRLAANDPTLTHLKLVRKPSTYFGDEFAAFLFALERNKTVTSVELSWRFLSALPAVQRVQLMGGLGSLASLEKLFMEAIGPCEALEAALNKTSNLKILWIGALRLASNVDVAKLTEAMRRNVSLSQINLLNIRVQVQGSYRVDNAGMVWFQENETKQAAKKLDLNPLLRVISEIPAMEKIQLDLKLNPDKMERINAGTLRSMCRPGLAFLMLRSCDLDDTDIAVIAEELKNTRSDSSLEMLNLSRNNKISEFGWTILAKMMEANYSLTCLITPTSSGPMEANYALAGRFAPYLAARNASLMEPSICTPPITETRAKIDFFLRLNEKGRKRLLSDRSITRIDWLDFMVREINDIDMIFFALQSVPSLFFL